MRIGFCTAFRDDQGSLVCPGASESAEGSLSSNHVNDEMQEPDCK